MQESCECKAKKKKKIFWLNTKKNKQRQNDKYNEEKKTDTRYYATREKFWILTILFF